MLILLFINQCITGMNLLKHNICNAMVDQITNYPADASRKDQFNKIKYMNITINALGYLSLFFDFRQGFR